MLQRIYEELKAADGPVDLPRLARTLGIDRSALDGMLMQMVRLGKLRELTSERSADVCCTGCSGSCVSRREGKVYAVVDDE
jgi:hypothetical protein